MTNVSNQVENKLDSFRGNEKVGEVEKVNGLGQLHLLTNIK